MIPILAFPEFKDTDELGQFMQHYTPYYELYSKSASPKPDFLLQTIGPPIPSVKTLAVIRDGVPDVALMRAAGISKAFSSTHALMRALAAKISEAFKHYYGEHDTAEGFSPDFATTLFRAHHDKPITAIIGDRHYQFNQGQLLEKVYMLGAYGDSVIARSNERFKNELTSSLGSRATTFNHLMDLVKTLEKNFVPSFELSDEQFATLGWNFDLDSVNHDFVKQAEEFHNARLYFYVRKTDISDDVKRRLFWKEPPPKPKNPIVISSSRDAACCLMALAEMFEQHAPNSHRKDMYTRLLVSFAQQSQQLAECITLDQAASFLGSAENKSLFQALETGIKMLESVDKDRFQKCRDALDGLKALRDRGLVPSTSLRSESTKPGWAH